MLLHPSQARTALLKVWTGLSVRPCFPFLEIAPMLFAYFPFYVLDGMLEVYTAGLHMWEVPKEPVLILLEDEPHEVAQAA